MDVFLLHQNFAIYIPTRQVLLMYIVYNGHPFRLEIKLINNLTVFDIYLFRDLVGSFEC